MIPLFDGHFFGDALHLCTQGAFCNLGIEILPTDLIVKCEL